MKLLILQFSPVFYSCHSLRSGCLPHHCCWMPSLLSSYVCTLTLSIGPFKSHISATGQNTSQFKCILMHFLILQVVFQTFVKLEI
jgi:hypothetical protein